MIDRKWLPLNALRAFDAVGRHSSFTAGAQALSVTQSALSRHVIYLEELVGKKLLDRKPQGVSLTEAGALLLPVVSKSFDRIEQVLNDIRTEAPTLARTLKVHMPPTFLQQLGLGVLRDFRAEHPDISIDITSSLGTGAPATDYDIGVIFDRPQVTGDIRDLLWMIRLTPVCSPEIAEAFHGRPMEEFLAQNELLHTRVEGVQRGQLWGAFARRGDVSISVDRGLSFDTQALAVQYAMSGGGVILADVDMFGHEIARGQLAAPFDASVEDGYGYYLSLHPEDLDDPLIALFRSWIISRFTGLDQRRTGVDI